LQQSKCLQTHRCLAGLRRLNFIELETR
jgi:hypothetical protein